MLQQITQADAKAALCEEEEAERQEADEAEKAAENEAAHQA